MRPINMWAVIFQVHVDIRVTLD